MGWGGVVPFRSSKREVVSAPPPQFFRDNSCAFRSFLLNFCSDVRPQRPHVRIEFRRDPFGSSCVIDVFVLVHVVFLKFGCANCVGN